ncbi:MAG: hypothetical protein WA994_04500 [Ornithinimicrobium sp.]
MNASLLIRDGDPWWMSPDIWTVPGSDPNGPAAPPAIGQSTFVWARVRNDGERALENIEIRFYWSNPATGVLRSNSTLVCVAFASIDVRESREVLCLTPWLPDGTNGGHQCLVAEAIHPYDPIPSPVPDAFTPRTHDQVAQRNIDLVQMAVGMMLALPIQTATPARIARQGAFRLIRHDEPLDDEQIRLMGIEQLEFEPDLAVTAGLHRGPELSCDDFDDAQELVVELPPGHTETIHLALRTDEMAPDRYCWLSVVELDRATKEEVGGVSFVIIGKEG